jgi:hypothetical protein
MSVRAVSYEEIRNAGYPVVRLATLPYTREYIKQRLSLTFEEVIPGEDNCVSALAVDEYLFVLADSAGEWIDAYLLDERGEIEEPFSRLFSALGLKPEQLVWREEDLRPRIWFVAQLRKDRTWRIIRRFRERQEADRFARLQWIVHKHKEQFVVGHLEGAPGPAHIVDLTDSEKAFLFETWAK